MLADSECTMDSVREYCAGPMSSTDRMTLWKWLLGVSNSPIITDWDTHLEHQDNELIQEEVMAITDDAETRERLSLVLSYYCTARNTRYRANCGWSEILLPLAPLSNGEMYACFYAILSKFIPRNCKQGGKPFHLFRLLLLYHDPELCAFLDTKKCSPDLYAQRWFRSLYVGKCNSGVIEEMWTRYLLRGDPFMVFYLGLVILVNARDVILEMGPHLEIAAKLTTFPDQLAAEDVEDFVSLAKYYSERTPHSFTRDYHGQLFGNAPMETNFGALSQALCLPISVSELLQRTSDDGVSYLVIDCRPCEQYKGGHLPGAMHLDPDLMLADPASFSSSVAMVLLTQRKSFVEEELTSTHLCFMGSGREEEDQLLNMVAAHFLHRKTQFVSTARGGYAALHSLLDGDVDKGLQDHSHSACIVCTEEISSRMSDSELVISNNANSESNRLVNKMSTALKVTSTNVKSKIGSYLSEQGSERHMRAVDPKSKPYRGVPGVFSIDDEEEEVGASSSEEEREMVNIELWKSRSDINKIYDCEEIRGDGYMFPSVMMLTNSHLYVVRRIQERDGMAYIRLRQAFTSIARITAKKKHPDVITFKFVKEDNELLTNRFLIPNSKAVTAEITSFIPVEEIPK